MLFNNCETCSFVNLRFGVLEKRREDSLTLLKLKLGSKMTLLITVSFLAIIGIWAFSGKVKPVKSIFLA